MKQNGDYGSVGKNEATPVVRTAFAFNFRKASKMQLEDFI